jgi:hypothetical protein
MKKRKWSFAILSLVFVCALTLTGCGKKGDPIPSKTLFQKAIPGGVTETSMNT